MVKEILIAVALLAFSAGPVIAHDGHTPLVGFNAGAMHPLTGFDHLLAMLAVGLWAAIRGDTARWIWPLAFVASMLAGFALSQAGVMLPGVEPTILASVIILGLACAVSLQLAALPGAILLGLFGLAHGYAHGNEAVSDVGVFVAGFTVATVLLHITGLTAAMLFRPVFFRVGGGLTAAAGLLLAIGVAI